MIGELRQILAQEYELEFGHIYRSAAKRNKRGEITEEAKERPWEDWLKMADNSPASLRAMERAVNELSKT